MTLFQKSLISCPPGLVRVAALSGAIDLAAKSAGIIPGSPCRELSSASAEGGGELTSSSHTAAAISATTDTSTATGSSSSTTDTPDINAEADPQLLQHNMAEVSNSVFSPLFGVFRIIFFINMLFFNQVFIIIFYFILFYVEFGQKFDFQFRFSFC